MIQESLSRTEKMEVINRANDASVFMRTILKTMGLQGNCTHIQFVEAFSKLQTDARTYEEELRQILFDGVKLEQMRPDPEKVEQEIVKEMHQSNGTNKDKAPLEKEYEKPYPY